MKSRFKWSILLTIAPLFAMAVIVMFSRDAGARGLYGNSFNDYGNITECYVKYGSAYDDKPSERTFKDSKGREYTIQFSVTYNKDGEEILAKDACKDIGSNDVEKDANNTLLYEYRAQTENNAPKGPAEKEEDYNNYYPTCKDQNKYPEESQFVGAMWFVTDNKNYWNDNVFPEIYSDATSTQLYLVTSANSCNDNDPKNNPYGVKLQRIYNKNTDTDAMMQDGTVIKEKDNEKIVVRGNFPSSSSDGTTYKWTNSGGDSGNGVGILGPINIPLSRTNGRVDTTQTICVKSSFAADYMRKDGETKDYPTDDVYYYDNDKKEIVYGGKNTSTVRCYPLILKVVEKWEVSPGISIQIKSNNNSYNYSSGGPYTVKVGDTVTWTHALNAIKGDPPSLNLSCTDGETIPSCNNTTKPFDLAMGGSSSFTTTVTITEDMANEGKICRGTKVSRVSSDSGAGAGETSKLCVKIENPWKITPTVSVDKKQAMPGDKVKFTYRITSDANGDPPSVGVAWGNEGNITGVGFGPENVNLGRSDYKEKIKEFTIPDNATIGTEYCQYTFVEDSDYNPGSKKATAGPVCVTVGKSPQINIRGADSYSGGKWASSTATTNPGGFEGGKSTSGTTNPRGSWSQYGLLVEGTTTGQVQNITNFGAAGYTGYSGSNACKLYFANSAGSGGCSTQSSVWGNLGAGHVIDLPDGYDIDGEEEAEAQGFSEPILNSSDGNINLYNQSSGKFYIDATNKNL
jgi:hypothetical protein